MPFVAVDLDQYSSDGSKTEGEGKNSRRVRVSFPLGSKKDSLESLKENREEEEMRRSSTVPDSIR